MASPSSSKSDVLQAKVEVLLDAREIRDLEKLLENIKMDTSATEEIRRMIVDQLRRLHGQHGLALADTPEGKYLNALAAEYGQGVIAPSAKTYDLPVAELHFGTRTRNFLDKAGIKYVGELIMYSEADLFRLGNFGRTSLREVKKCLDRLGVKLGMKALGYVSPEQRKQE